MTPRKQNWGLVAALVVIAAMPYLWPYLPMAADALGKGTDDGARNAIHEIAPGFEPWMDSLWSPPNSTAERALFSLQAAGGACALYWVTRVLRNRQAAEK